MDDIEQKIKRLRGEVTAAQQDQARAEAALAAAEGHLAGTRSALAEEFKVTDIETARALHGRLGAALEAGEAKVRQLMAQAGGEQ
jgi:hypothetical protein